jgi:membrane protease YdiL (CAAX protease family)
VHADAKVALGIVVSVVAVLLFAVLHARTNAWWNAPLCALVGFGLYRLLRKLALKIVDRYLN